MNVKSTEQANGKAKIVVEIEKQEFEAALNKAQNKAKKDIMVPGFRKGKAPRKVVEGMYGAKIFYEDAVNEIFPEIYGKAVIEQQLKAVGAPSISDMDERIRDMLDELSFYYENGLWLRDFEADERGELPKKLKRGVLSEDGLYNLFSEIV